MAETGSRNEINQRHIAYIKVAINNNIMVKKHEKSRTNETGYYDYCHKPGLLQAKHEVQSF